MKNAFTTRPELRGTYGAVSSTHWLATGSAMAMMEKGGNAFDAAVCGAFVLHVVEPHLNGPGGEVPIMFWSEKERRSRVLCGQGVAPATATIERFSSLGFNMIPGIGLLPACVPGAFGAWATLLRDYGTMSLREVLEPAIEYATRGYPLVPKIVQAIVAVQHLFRDHWPSSAQVYLPGGVPPAPSELFRNPALAATYSRILQVVEGKSTSREGQIDAAMDCWYRGFVADEIDAFYRGSELMDSSGRPQRGLLSGDDLHRWHPTYEEPVTVDYGNYSVAKCGPWSQGPVLLQQLNLVADQVADLDPTGEAFIHLLAEAGKLSYADRDAWYADPGAINVPLAHLLSRAYSAGRRTLMGKTASAEIRAGAPGGRTPQTNRHEALAREFASGGFLYGAGEPTFADYSSKIWSPTEEVILGDTCQINAIDRFGNVVAATPSGGWLSSSPVVPALGFSLSTRLQTCWLDPAMQNALRPGYRPFTTLSPTLVFANGEPYMACGTPGGDQQDQWQTSFLLRHLVHGMGLQEAIDAPAWHINHFTNSFWPRQVQRNEIKLESRFSLNTIDALRRRGHSVMVGEPWSEGRLSACALERKGGQFLFRAAANPRGMQGYAIVR